VHAPRIGNTGAQLCSGEIGVLVHHPSDQGVGSGVQGGSRPARMRVGRDVASRTVTASALLDKRETDPEEVRERALGAEPAPARMKNLLS
jgi:hypothetical protein